MGLVILSKMTKNLIQHGRPLKNIGTRDFRNTKQDYYPFSYDIRVTN